MSEEMPHEKWDARHRLEARFASLRSCGAEPPAVRFLPWRRPMAGAAAVPSPDAVAAPPGGALYLCYDPHGTDDQLSKRNLGTLSCP